MHLTAERRTASRLDSQVERMLTALLGVWPEPATFRVVPSARRLTPGWDGRPQPLAGVATGADLDHAVVLSVPPPSFPAVGALVQQLAACRRLSERAELGRRLPAAMGLGRRHYGEAVLRFATAPAPLPWVGQWRPADHPALPPWLRAFHGDVLVSLDRNGRFLAGVGVKRHHPLAREIAVGTAPHARGRGLARSLVAQAASRVLADGAVPLYLHDESNTASARVADAAGFPDRGWRWLQLRQE